MAGFEFDDDRITLSTPEGVGIDLVVAGLGSRFTAMLIDQAILTAMLLALAIVVSLVSGAAGQVVLALVIAAFFLTQFGYFIVFEVLDHGRSVGKRLVGLRVVRTDGTGVGFLASAIRNVLRIIDSIPGAYLVGAVAVLVTPRQQRLGDLAAGTIVIRDRDAPSPAPAFSPAFGVGPPPPQLAAVAGQWDLSGISAADTAAVRAFLSRRHDLPPQVRWNLALQFDRALRPRAVGVPAQLPPEQFLEAMVWAKSTRT